MVEYRNGAIYALRILILLQVTSATQIKIVRSRFSRSVIHHRGAILVLEFRLQHIQHAIHNTILQGKRIARLSSNCLGLELVPRLRVNEAVVDPDQCSGLADASLEHEVCAKALMRLLDGINALGQNLTRRHHLQRIA